MRSYTSLFLLFLVLGLPYGFALDPDFYKQKEIKRELKRERERGAKALTRARKSRVIEKDEEIIAFSKIRKKMKIAKVKREKLFEKDLKDKEKFKSRKHKQALKLALRKRKKPKSHWKDEILEYGISTPQNKKNN